MHLSIGHRPDRANPKPAAIGCRRGRKDGAFSDGLQRSLQLFEWGRARFHTSLAAVVCLLSISMAHADSSSQDLIKAIKTWDVGALQAQATQASDIGRQGLPRGVLKAFAGEDDAAIDLLKELIASRQLDGELRFAAFDELGTLYLRNQHYLQAAGAFESALGLYGNVTNEETEDLKDSLRYARAFGAVAPMTVAVVSEKDSPVMRDAMDLPRISTKINGHPVDAIMDTGATNSVVSVFTAKRLHLRMVRFRGGVTSETGRVAAQFAVADTLLFAGHEFRSVPFFVLPDEAVNIPLAEGMMGKVEPLIGLSVLRRLGRLEVVHHDGQERLRVGGASSADIPTNLLLPKGLPLVLVRIDPEGTELRMSFDTGSNRTALGPAAISAHPSLAGGAAEGRARIAGAGGISSNDAAIIIPQLALRIGRVTSPLSNVPVTPVPDNCDGTRSGCVALRRRLRDRLPSHDRRNPAGSGGPMRCVLDADAQASIHAALVVPRVLGASARNTREAICHVPAVPVRIRVR